MSIVLPGSGVLVVNPVNLSGLAKTTAANVFDQGLQTFIVEDSTSNSPTDVAVCQHRVGAMGAYCGSALRFESRQIGSDPIVTGRVRSRWYGGDGGVELLPNRPGGTDPDVGLRVRCTVDHAVNGVEVLVAAGSAPPTIQPCVAALSVPDLDLIVKASGTGSLRLGSPVQLPDGTRLESGTITTFDDTETTVWKKLLDDDTVYELDVTLVGRRTDAAGRAVYRRRVVVYVEGGTLTVGTPDVIGTDVETSAGYDITLDGSGSYARVRATGDTGHTICWDARVILLAASS